MQHRHVFVLRVLVACAWILSLCAPWELLADTQYFPIPSVSTSRNDGNDVGWTHYSPLEPFDFGADYSFPNGNSYQIDVPGNYIVPEIERGRAGSMVTGSNYSDFRITVDVLGWNDGREYVFGPIARASTPGLGTTNGYLLLLHASDHDFQLLRIEGEAPADEELGTADIEMPPERQFRIVYSGLGPQLSAMVYNLNNLSTPLGAFTADTENYLPPPAPEPYTTGQVGLIVAQADGPTDPAPPPGAPYAATFDNFRVTVPTAAEWNALGGGSISEGFNWIGNSMPQGAGVHAKFLHGVETDAGGLKLDALEDTLQALKARGLLGRVKLLYTISEHSNPTGVSLTAPA